MSDLFRGLFERKSISLEGRLKVACYLWKEKTVLTIPGKKNLLLKWGCQELCLVYDKRIKSSSLPDTVMVCKLWSFLHVVLVAIGEEKEAQLTDLSPINVYLLQAITSVLSAGVAQLEEESMDVTKCAELTELCPRILQCILGMLELPQFPPAFSLFETMVSLVETVLLLGVAYLNHTPRYLDHLELLGSVLSHLLPYHKYLVSTRGNHKKVFASTCQRLLLPVLRLKYLMVRERKRRREHEWEGKGSNTAKVMEGLDSIIRSLFSSDHLSEYSSALSSSAQSGQTSSPGSSSDGAAVKSPVSSVRVLFDVLESSLKEGHDLKEGRGLKEECDLKEGRGLKEGLDMQSVQHSLPFFLNSFLEENSTSCQVPRSVEFKFFSKILHLLAVQDESVLSEEPSSHCGPSAEELRCLAMKFLQRKERRKNIVHAQVARRVAEQEKMVALQNCLESILQHGVYQVIEDKKNNEVQTCYLRCLTLSIFSRMLQFSGISSTVYGDILVVLQRLNHSLVEPWLSLVWILAPFSVSPVSLQNWSQGNEEDTPIFFVDVCIGMYTRLRQLPLLLEKRLEAITIIKKTYSKKVKSILQAVQLSHPSTMKRLGQHISCLPPGQATEVLASHVEHLKTQLQDILSSSQLNAMCSVEEEFQPLHAGSVVKCSWRSSVALFSSVEGVGLVLRCVPTSMWEMTRTREKAGSLLKLLVRKLSAILMDMGKQSSNVYKDSLLVSSSLLLTSECCRLLLYLSYTLPSLSLPEWPLELNEAVLDDVMTLRPVPAGWLQSECELQPLAQYLILSSLVAGNLLVGYLSLLTYELTSLYEYCEEEHLHNMADVLLLSLNEEGQDSMETANMEVMVDEEDISGVRVTHGEVLEKKVTGMDVVDCFLGSEGFMEMKKLQFQLLSCCLKQCRVKKLPKSLSEAMKISSCSSNNENDEVFLSRVLTVLEGVLEYALTLKETERPLAVSSSELVAKQKVFLKVLQAIPLVGMSRSVLLRCLLQAMVHQVLTMCLLMDSHSSCSAPYFSDLTCVIIHLLKSVTGGKKKLKRKFSMDWELLLKWWYCCYGIVEDHQKFSKQQYADGHVSSLVTMEMTLEMAFSSAAGKYPSDFISSLLAEVEITVHRSSQVLLLVCERACRAQKQGKMVVDSDALSSLCCKVVKVVMRQMQQKGIKVMLPSCCYLFTLLAHVASHCRGSKNGSEMVMFVDSCSRLGEELMRLWSLEAQDFLVQLLKSTLLMQDPLVPSLLDQVLAVFSIFIIMLTPASSSQAVVSTHNGVEELDEMDVAEDSVGGSREAMASGQQVWTLFRNVLASFSEKLVEAASSDDSIWLMLLEGHGGVSGKFQVESKGRQVANISSLVWKTVIDKLSHTLCHILNTITHEDAMATIAAECSREKGLETPANSLLYCLIWQELVSHVSSLNSKIRTSLRQHLQQVLGFCYALVVTGHAHYLTVMAIHLMCQVMALPSQAYSLDTEVVMKTLQVHTTPTDPSMQLQGSQVTIQLLLAMLRQHTPAVTAKPGPFVVAVNRLLHTLVVLGQEHDSFLPTLLLCSSDFSRLLEMFSRQATIYKFFAYIIHDFLVVSHEKPLKEEVKETLLPGIFGLIKGCTPPELTFLKASLEPHIRDSFGRLMTKFDTSYKFGGRM